MSDFGRFSRKLSFSFIFHLSYYNSPDFYSPLLNKDYCEAVDRVACAADKRTYEAHGYIIIATFFYTYHIIVYKCIMRVWKKTFYKNNIYYLLWWVRGLCNSVSIGKQNGCVVAEFNNNYQLYVYTAANIFRP